MRSLPLHFEVGEKKSVLLCFVFFFVVPGESFELTIAECRQTRYRELLSAAGELDTSDSDNSRVTMKNVAVSAILLREMFESSLLGPFQVCTLLT